MPDNLTGQNNAGQYYSLPGTTTNGSEIKEQSESWGKPMDDIEEL